MKTSILPTGAMKNGFQVFTILARGKVIYQGTEFERAYVEILEYQRDRRPPPAVTSDLLRQLEVLRPTMDQTCLWQASVAPASSTKLRTIKLKSRRSPQNPPMGFLTRLSCKHLLQVYCTRGHLHPDYSYRHIMEALDTSELPEHLYDVRIKRIDGVQHYALLDINGDEQPVAIFGTYEAAEAVLLSADKFRHRGLHITYYFEDAPILHKKLKRFRD
mgnify:CR=1 FL=1